jgi:hypothetical protein
VGGGLHIRESKGQTKSNKKTWVTILKYGFENHNSISKEKKPKTKKKGCTEYSSLSIVVASLKKKPHARKEGTKWGMCPWLVLVMIILLLLLLHKEVLVWRLGAPQ